VGDLFVFGAIVAAIAGVGIAAGLRLAPALSRWMDRDEEADGDS
jgi:hypothetical protein